jgi:acyl-CoA reductase-like NAD-dependent aldehyde dehydrogenase
VVTVSDAYTPLHDPEKDAQPFTPPLDQAIARARKVLDEKAQANIHDRDAMIRAAAGLDYVLRDLLAALDAAEAGDV